jgi:hypothetical protein
VGFPGSLGSAPTITNPSSQTASFTPTTDGAYVIKLVRTDAGSVVTTDVRFFAIADTDYGYVLPSAGMTGNMTNILGSSAAQAAGWEGSSAASTNVFLDALLRFLRATAGRFLGNLATVNFSSASPSTVTVVDATDSPWRVLNLTGTALYTEQIANSSPTPTTGKRFVYKVSLTAGSGGFALLNGVSGSSILALTAPPNGTFSYGAEVAFDGTNWQVVRVGIGTDPLAVSKTQTFLLSAGTQTNNTVAFQRGGNKQIDPTKYPSNAQAIFNAIVLTTSGSVPVSVQLYDLTAGAVVTASPSFPITSSVQGPTLISTTLTLTAASHLYEVQFKMGNAGAGTDMATLSYADVVLTWG